MERRRLQFAVWMTVLALPILVIDNVPRASARAGQTMSTGAGDDVDRRRLVALRAQQAAGELGADPRRLLALQAQRAAASAAAMGAAPPPTTAAVTSPGPDATAAPPASPPTTAGIDSAPPESAPAPPTTAPAPTTTAAPTTTTAAPTPTPTTTTAPAAGRTEVGSASWYDHRAGTCAHRSLPFGTVVTVTNLSNGASTTCTVADRGPFIDGRVIDLNRDVYVRVADISTGVFRARITW